MTLIERFSGIVDWVHLHTAKPREPLSFIEAAERFALATKSLGMDAKELSQRVKHVEKLLAKETAALRARGEV